MGQKPNAPQAGRFCLLHRWVGPPSSPTTCPTATYYTSKEIAEACHTFREKIKTQMHRVAARHEFPFRPSNRPKRTGFQTSHPSTCHGEARDTRGRGRACPPRERASKTRKSHAPFVWKASRGGTRGPGTHLPKKWHKGGWKRKGCWSRKLQRSPRTNDGNSGAHIQMVYDPTKEEQSFRR